MIPLFGGDDYFANACDPSTLQGVMSEPPRWSLRELFFSVSNKMHAVSLLSILLSVLAKRSNFERGGRAVLADDMIIIELSMQLLLIFQAYLPCSF